MRDVPGARSRYVIYCFTMPLDVNLRTVHPRKLAVVRREVEPARGPYRRLNETHDAVKHWMAENRRKFAGYSGEIYGDPTPDPAATETTVLYLLK